MQIIEFDEDDLDEARDRICDLLADWQQEGRTPSTLLVALVEIMDDIEDKAKSPLQ
ncbi:hypothetical protein [Roseovarius sp.]|uniref:hypothetical protein n=1 Tax=Roseovarius sp. TaxID=1486281 RepID=UPI003BABEA4B